MCWHWTHNEQTSSHAHRGQHIEARSSRHHIQSWTINTPTNHHSQHQENRTTHHTMSANDKAMPKSLWRLTGGTGAPPTLGEWKEMLERRKQRRKQGVTQMGWANPGGGGFMIEITSYKGSKRNRGNEQ